jgi:nucleoside-diphosphate-sugar epimerase
MKEICILGQNGFIGKTVTEYLRQKYIVKDSGPCEVLVNCAGFAIMHEAAKNPDKMREVEDITFSRIKAVSFDRLIHLSSIYIDASPDDNYSIIKRVMENRIVFDYPNTTILRSSSVIGRGLKKNVLFDLMKGNSLWVTPFSMYNYISSEELAKIIEYFIENPVFDIFTVGASDSIMVKDIVEMWGRDVVYGPKTDCIIADISKLRKLYKVKTSREYIIDFWKESFDV